MESNFAELFEDSKKTWKVKDGDLAQGRVTEVNSKAVHLDAGLKSEGIIPIGEFYDAQGNATVKLGDMVEIFIESVENGFGEAILSRETAKSLRSQKEMEDAYANGKTISGYVFKKIKGGFTVDFSGVNAFLPGALVDTRPSRDISLESLKGRKLEFMVIKLDRERGNAIVSHRAVLEAHNSEKRKELLNSLREGMRLKGIVKNIKDYGAFLDLGVIDGLLHITDISWTRIQHPTEILELDQELEVVVLKYDIEQGRVSLGLKQTTPDPWALAKEQFPLGTRLFGVVTTVVNYGCFVKINDCLEGLLHVSQMDWFSGRGTPDPKMVSPGEKVEVEVLNVDSVRRRISLGMKQCKPNPWKIFQKKYPTGSILNGTVKTVNSHGVFVQLEGEEVDGLVHMGNVSWTDTPKDVIPKFPKGSKLNVMVMSVDTKNLRVALSIKHIEKNPYAAFAKKHTVGSTVECTITELCRDERVIVSVGNGTITTEVSIAKVAEQMKGIGDEGIQLKVGSVISAKVISYGKRKDSITLSPLDSIREEQKKLLATYTKKGRIGTSLGSQIDHSILTGITELSQSNEDEDTTQHTAESSKGKDVLHGVDASSASATPSTSEPLPSEEVVEEEPLVTSAKGDIDASPDSDSNVASSASATPATSEPLPSEGVVEEETLVTSAKGDIDASPDSDSNVASSASATPSTSEPLPSEGGVKEEALVASTGEDIDTSLDSDSNVAQVEIVPAEEASQEERK